MSAITTVYVERAVRDHPRTVEILARLPVERTIECERYGEVFNRRAQSFRLQKARPALILARKHDRHVLEAPGGYAVGGGRNYYFSHLLNCPYDCRYCFLQGMYRSAHYVLFVNYGAFGRAIDGVLDRHAGEEVYFFSGYDGDSLAFEGVSGFCAEFLPFFAERPHARLELRTKSTRIVPLVSRAVVPNAIVAMSFTPRVASERWELGVPSLKRRLDALARLGGRGWPLGLRFDPLLWWPGCLEHYDGLFESVLDRLDESWIHSVSLGAFRLPRPFFRRLLAEYPDEPLLAAPLTEHERMVGYRPDLEEELVAYCSEWLERRLGPERLFPCSFQQGSGAAAAGSAEAPAAARPRPR